jgi:ribonuclease Y
VLWEVIFTVGGLIVGFIIGIVVFKLLEKRYQSNATKAAQALLDNAKKESERLVKEAKVSVKEELFLKREELENETLEIRKELKSWERRLAKREDGIERKLEVLNKKERFLETQEKNLQSKTEALKSRETELSDLIESEKQELHRISGLSRDEAVKILLKRLEKEVEYEQAQVIQRITERYKEEADKRGKEILTTAIQRVAADHTAETVVSTIDIPNDEMKGRIIGREGRNIRAFEKATGVDVIVDDTPGVIVVSGFDSVRREMARRSMEKLITDGRIHPSRIEEVVESTKKEMNDLIMEIGKQAAFDVGVPGLHPKVIQLLGRMKFRTSYGQNVLQHSIEVAHLCAMIAGELGLNVQLAKRCGLLHDIGKAVDHELEGGHPEIGADLARRYEERSEVVNAVASHHEGAPQETLYAVITQAADAISGARPGARRETLEKYIKRLEKLEGVANSFAGVKQAYAIQAGREIRVIVNSNRVSDKQAVKLARDIAKEIENELTYPGEVKVTLLRETRVVEYAR